MQSGDRSVVSIVLLASVTVMMAGTGPAEMDCQKWSATVWRTLVLTCSKCTGARQDFCREHGVAASALSGWRRWLQENSGSVGSQRRRRPVVPVQTVSMIELPAIAIAVQAVPLRRDIKLQLGEGAVRRLRRSTRCGSSRVLVSGCALHLQSCSSPHYS